MAVNLSMRNLHDSELIEEVASLLAKFEVRPAGLRIEVTESTLRSEPLRALDSLMRLRAIGVEIAIDDFGTGHASLSHLKHLPVDEIKLDRSFIKDMRTDKKDFTIVRSTIELAHELGLRVVAGGVEDQPTWDLLVHLKCDLAQGHHKRVYALTPAGVAALRDRRRDWERFAASMASILGQARNVD